MCTQNGPQCSQKLNITDVYFNSERIALYEKILGEKFLQVQEKLLRLWLELGHKILALGSVSVNSILFDLFFFIHRYELGRYLDL